MGRAGRRYHRADGRRLAAAVSFYGFFAVFALTVIGFAALGYMLDNPAAQRAVERFLAENLPVSTPWRWARRGTRPA